MDEDLKKGEEFVGTMRVSYTSTNAISTDKLPTVGQAMPTWRKHNYYTPCVEPRYDLT